SGGFSYSCFSIRFALVPIAILTLVMSAATLVASVWVIRLWVAAPHSSDIAQLGLPYILI
ncbi:MAG: hypothetical protein ACJ8AG_30990, partial [Ktedonobacteraceae bacterium]